VLDAADAKKMVISKDVQRVDIDNIGHAPLLTELQARTAITDFLESQS
jgi:hypothetical protein